MAKRLPVVLCCWTLLAFGAALTAHAETVQARELVHRILAANATFLKANGPEHFRPFIDGQHPSATVLSCSDSRVQMDAIDATPDNDLFVIRNIGNQMATSEGSVEYGVHHLHTPILLIIGHVRCGAVQAALGDYSRESPAIRRELVTLKVAKGGNWLEGVRTNVGDQVKAAMAAFASEVREGSLTVVGAIYDFADDLHQGNGRLVVVSINGETDPGKIRVFLGETAGEKK